MKTLFVTGTGTDVGKTVATAVLASLMKRSGVSFGVSKPVQTGSADDFSDLNDIHDLVPKIKRLPDRFETQYCLSLPASPHLAAAEEGVRVESSKIVEAIGELAELNLVDFLLVEGAGGVYVPLNDKELTVDLIKKIGAPAVVVADAELGTINHTLLTVEALKNHGIEIKGIVLNRFPENPSVIVRDNVKTIEQWTGEKVLFTIPEWEKIDARLLDTYSTSLDVESLTSLLLR